MPTRKKPTSTSWGNVADWYDQHLKAPAGTYHREVIWPNLQRLSAVKKGQTVLDVACGNGFFSRELFHEGATVIGVDMASELIALAKKQSPKEIAYHVAPAHAMPFVKEASVDVALLSLAIQNIENVKNVLSEINRTLKPGGKLFVIMNHPAFRQPKTSFWGFDDKQGKLGQPVQYRRIDEYLSESKVKIQMHPGALPDEVTVSFHRPLQYYFKALNKTGFVVGRLEEWMSHKSSAKGPKKEAEDKARKEIPMFLCLEAIKQ